MRLAELYLHRQLNAADAMRGRAFYSFSDAP